MKTLVFKITMQPVIRFFGAGLVNTINDFGSQGEWPSHPDLLDWLAVDFGEGGWDVKKFFKLLVTSAVCGHEGAAQARGPSSGPHPEA